MKEERIKILKAKEVKKKGNAGELIDNKLTVACSTNAIQILKIQKEGKRSMNASEFLAGNNLDKGRNLN